MDISMAVADLERSGFMLWRPEDTQWKLLSCLSVRQREPGSKAALDKNAAQAFGSILKRDKAAGRFHVSLTRLVFESVAPVAIGQRPTVLS